MINKKTDKRDLLNLRRKIPNKYFKQEIFEKREIIWRNFEEENWKMKIWTLGIGYFLIFFNFTSRTIVIHGRCPDGGLKIIYSLVISYGDVSWIIMHITRVRKIMQLNKNMLIRINSLNWFLKLTNKWTTTSRTRVAFIFMHKLIRKALFLAIRWPFSAGTSDGK